MRAVSPIIHLLGVTHAQPALLGGFFPQPRAPSPGLDQPGRPAQMLGTLSAASSSQHAAQVGRDAAPAPPSMAHYPRAFGLTDPAEFQRLVADPAKRWVSVLFVSLSLVCGGGRAWVYAGYNRHFCSYLLAQKCVQAGV